MIPPLPTRSHFTDLNYSEHTVDCYITDSGSNRIAGEFTHDRVVNIGIGSYYVAVGDSITFGVGDDFDDDDISLDGRQTWGGFTPVLNDLLTVALGTPVTVVDEGVPGAVSADGVTLISDILSRHPDAQHILVLYGMNDALRSDSYAYPVIPSGLGLSSGDAGYAGSYKANMQQIINKIHTAGKTVSLAKIPISLGDNDYEGSNFYIREYNRVIDELVANPANDITVTPPDLYGYFLINYANEYSDQIHPNGLGYRSIADLWNEALTQ